MAAGEEIEVLHWANLQQQLKDIGERVRQMALDMAALRRQYDEATGERQNLAYRVSLLEKRPENDRQRYTLYTLFGGCAYMIVSIVVMIVISAATIYFAHH